MGGIGQDNISIDIKHMASTVDQDQFIENELQALSYDAPMGARIEIEIVRVRSHFVGKLTVVSESCKITSQLSSGSIEETTLSLISNVKKKLSFWKLTRRFDYIRC